MDTTSPITPHPPALRVDAVDSAIEYLEENPTASATAAAKHAAALHNVSHRSVMRWAVDQKRDLATYGKDVAVKAETTRTLISSLKERREQRGRLMALIDAEAARLEAINDDEDRSARIQRLAGAHARLVESAARDDLHGARIGDPDALAVPPPPPPGDDDGEMPPNISAIGEALARAAADRA